MASTPLEITRQYGWPNRLLTSTAVAYTQRSKTTILRALGAGALVAVGRRGRSYVFDRDELDRWMAGTPIERPAHHVEDNHVERPRATSATADSLARIREIGRGAR